MTRSRSSTSCARDRAAARGPAPVGSRAAAAAARKREAERGARRGAPRGVSPSRAVLARHARGAPAATGPQSRARAYGRRAPSPRADAHRRDLRGAAARAVSALCAARCARVRVATQYQEELPVQRPARPRVSRRTSASAGSAAGACKAAIRCRPPTRSGAAAVQLGPQAVALAVLLNKRFGLPYGKIAALLRDRFGLTVTRGGLVHAVHRAARQAQPTYDALCATVRGSPVVTADETSWRVDADLQWLWAFVTPRHDRLCDSAGPRAGASGARHRRRLCRRAAARRLAVVSAISRTPRIRRVSRTCCAAVACCCSTIREQPFVTAVKAILQAALRTRDRYHAGTISAHGLAVARGHYLERLGHLLTRTPSRRLARAPVSTASHRRIRRHLQLPLRPDARRHQLARRARAAPGGRHAQNVRRRQSHRAAAPTVSKSSPACSAPPTSAASMPPTCSSTLLTAPTPDGAAEPPSRPRGTLTR